MASHHTPTVDDICKDFGVSREELVAILAQDESVMTSLSRKSKPIFLRKLDKEASRLTTSDSPFSTASTAPNTQSSTWAPRKYQSGRTPEHREDSKSNPASSRPSQVQSQHTGATTLALNDGPEVVNTLLGTLREQASVLHTVTKAVTRYESNMRVGQMLGGVGAMLAAREPDSDALGKMMGLFALSNFVPKEYVSLLSRFGYSSLVSSNKQLREYLIDQQEESFARPALRRLERYLANYETTNAESLSHVSLDATATAPSTGKRKREFSSSRLDSTTRTSSSETVSKSFLYPQMSISDVPRTPTQAPARSTSFPPPPPNVLQQNRPWAADCESFAPPAPRQPREFIDGNYPNRWSQGHSSSRFSEFPSANREDSFRPP
ncbi:hypothetical protein BJ742DRAFT_791226 [Cladochytrium replicatum]|nr:hypothetical protein BJ742DRAFT_791226 [Cladochytrium replicatum]